MVWAMTIPLRQLWSMSKASWSLEANELIISLLSTQPFNTRHANISCSQVIWLGDLNYRIALSYRAAKALVEMRNWKALLENDQVHVYC